MKTEQHWSSCKPRGEAHQVFFDAMPSNLSDLGARDSKDGAPSRSDANLDSSAQAWAGEKDSLRFRERRFEMGEHFCAENPHRFPLPKCVKGDCRNSESSRVKDLVIRYGAFIEPATILAQSLVGLTSSSAAQPGGLHGWEVVLLDQKLRRLHRTLFGTWALLIQDFELCMDMLSDRDDQSFPESLLP